MEKLHWQSIDELKFREGPRSIQEEPLLLSNREPVPDVNPAARTKGQPSLWEASPRPFRSPLGAYLHDFTRVLIKSKTA